MFTDSHCHLNFPELSTRLPEIFDDMARAKVSRALCVSTTIEEFDAVHAIAMGHPQLWASAGVHPDNEGCEEPSVETLVRLCARPKVVAVGETGLDYYRLNGRSIDDMAWQRQRFVTHIHAAQLIQKPLIIHTRNASADTIDLLNAHAGLTGVFHCFTETKTVAKQALDLGFYISFSGIITFKSAQDLRDVVKFVPLDRVLIETDSPYLAPVPHRGKTNSPAYVPLVARAVASLKDTTVETIAQVTSTNFDRLFLPTQQ